MAQIPLRLESPQLKGLKLLTDGKVRGMYSGLARNLLLQRASNRVSIFDFILDALIEQKGEILTALTVFWLTEVLQEFPSHLVAYGKGIDEYLPKNLQGDIDLMKRALIIKKFNLAPIEAIVRFFLTGSGWKSYEKTGKCYGHSVPVADWMWNGMELPYPIFTPTEKSDTDPWIHHDKVSKLYGSAIERTALQIAIVVRKYLQNVELDLLDTKMELTAKGEIGDEIITPDSSRIVDLQERIAMAAKQKLASSLDKQFVRNWGSNEGIDKLDPTNPDDIAKVQRISVPDEIISQTRQIYRYLFWRITGQKLEKFQSLVMDIPDARPPKVKVAVILGSRSDLKQCSVGLVRLQDRAKAGRIDFELNICSCHRNPDETKSFAIMTKADVIIAGAGMAAALPGILKAHLRKVGKKIPVIGVAFEGTRLEGSFNNEYLKDTEAAQLSIERLPGQPVILDQNGKAFTGPKGFLQACMLAIDGEFMPEKIPAGKEAEFGIEDYMVEPA